MKSESSTYLVPQGIPFETKSEEDFFPKFVPIFPGDITRDSTSECFPARYQVAALPPHGLD